MAGVLADLFGVAWLSVVQTALAATKTPLPNLLIAGRLIRQFLYWPDFNNHH